MLILECGAFSRKSPMLLSLYDLTALHVDLLGKLYLLIGNRRPPDAPNLGEALVPDQGKALVPSLANFSTLDESAFMNALSVSAYSHHLPSQETLQ
jgi:hypothetical protein